MDYLIQLKTQFKADKKQLEEAIAHAQKARDEAPSATESHSDTSRATNERLVNALEQKLADLDNLISQIPTQISSSDKVRLWDKVVLASTSMRMEVVLVPEGYGGKQIGMLRLVSTDSPLGANIVGKSFGTKFSQGTNEFEITRV